MTSHIPARFLIQPSIHTTLSGDCQCPDMCGNFALGRSLTFVSTSVNMPKAGAEAPTCCAAALAVLWAAECAHWA
eukprot:1042503-Amphidinium_carterae.1